MPHQPYTNGKLARDLGVLCLCAASVLLTIAYRIQVGNMRDVIYQRCNERQIYDNASNDLRDDMALRFRQFAQQERENRFIDEDLRQKRVTAWESLATSAEKTVNSQVKTTCNAYR